MRLWPKPPRQGPQSSPPRRPFPVSAIGGCSQTRTASPSASCKGNDMGNPMFHWELMVNDVDKAIDFYSKVFDWEIDRSSFPNYPLIKTGSNPGGGILKKPEMVPNPALNIYFHTEDIEDTLT